MAAAMARPIPVLPLVGSTITPPGLSSPARSAASIMGSAIRSLTDPPGFICSSLPTIRGLSPAARRSSATRGVFPIAAETSGRMPRFSAGFGIGRLPGRAGLIGLLVGPRLGGGRSPASGVAQPEERPGHHEPAEPQPGGGRDAGDHPVLDPI